MEPFLEGKPQAVLSLLTRVAERIRAFAAAQRASVADVSVRVPGGISSIPPRAHG